MDVNIYEPNNTAMILMQQKQQERQEKRKTLINNVSEWNRSSGWKISKNAEDSNNVTHQV